MKKFFGGSNKPKPPKSSSKDGPADDPTVPTPIFQQHAMTATQSPTFPPASNPASQQTPTAKVPRKSSREEERWEVITPYVVAPPLGSPNTPRSPSPYQASQMSIPPSTKLTRERDTQSLRKSPLPAQPVVSNILRALEPPSVESVPHSNLSQSEDGNATNDGFSRDPRDTGEKRERRGFFGWERSRDHGGDRDRYSRDRGRDSHRKEDENTAELTRMIGYLTATASEDWSLVLDVCERASASENNAKEAVRALRREFKFGEPPGQLSAARLWAIMLRNCSDVFISQSTSRKFLDTIEDLLGSSRTSPVVRERLLDVIAAAAYASGSKKDGRSDRDGFRGLWRRVKPFDKPDEGMPFETGDAMFNPPASRMSQYDFPAIVYQEPYPQTNDVLPASPPPTTRPHKKRKSPTRNRIIPHDEDVRRLFQECKIGQGNATVLSHALAYAKPEGFKKDAVIKEFHAKCRKSQELIFAQIPWASAEAEKSIIDKEKRKVKDKTREVVGDTQQETTKEEQLLAAILAAHAELIEVLKQYEDMERVAIERKAEYRSMKEAKMDRREAPEILDSGNHNIQQAVAPPSRSPSPSIRSTSPHHSLAEVRRHPPPDALTGGLAPPPLVPHGPRSPGQFSIHSRTPSPNAVTLETSNSYSIYLADARDEENKFDSSQDSGSDEDTPPQPSAKALGKQRAVEFDVSGSRSQYAGGNYYDTTSGRRNSHSFDDSDQEDQADPPWHRPIQYVYDAAAERLAQQAVLINGVH